MSLKFRAKNHDLLFASILLYVAILICDIRPLNGLSIWIVILLQVFTGGEIYRYFREEKQISVVEYFSFGFSLGSLAWIVSDQIFIYASWPHVGWVLPVALAGCLRLFRQKSNGFEINTSFVSLHWICAATFFGLSGEWAWTLPASSFAVLLLLARHYVSRSERSDYFNRTVVVLITAAVSATIFLRPTNWWISSGDVHFYEGLAKSVSTWGSRESIFSAGYSLQYHWFSYAWSGLVTRVANSPDWIVLTRVGIIVPALCIFSFVWQASTRLSRHSGAPIISVLLVAASSVFGEWFVSLPLAMISSFSQLFATLWLLPVLIWAIDVERSGFSRSGLYLAFLFVGLVGGKVSHAAIGASFLISFQLFRLIRNGRSRKLILFEIFSVLTVMITTSLILFGSGGSLSPRPFAWASYLQGDLYDFFGRALWAAAGVLAIGMIYLSTSLLVFGGRILRQSPGVYFGLGTALVSGLLFSNLSSGPASPNGLFFLHASVILIVSVGGSVLADLFGKPMILSKFEIFLFGLVAVSAVLIIYLIPNLDSGSNSAIWLRASRTTVVFIPILVAIVYFFIRTFRRSLPALGCACLFSICIVSVTTFLSTNTISYLSDFRGYSRNVPYLFPSQDLRELSLWMSKNTNETDVYASNYICEGELCSEPHLSRRALLSVTLERRALIEAPWISSAFTEPKSRDGSGDFKMRETFSAKFAYEPSPEALDFFRLRSVRWYIIDLDRLNNGRWEASKASVFSNDSFVVVDLSKLVIRAGYDDV